MRKLALILSLIACVSAKPDGVVQSDQLPIAEHHDDVEILDVWESGRVSRFWTSCTERIYHRQRRNNQQSSSYDDHGGNLVGEIVGGAAGGLIGSRLGKGDGRVAAAAAGTLIGTIAGNRLTKRRQRDKRNDTVFVERTSRPTRCVEEREIHGHNVRYRHGDEIVTIFLPERSVRH